MCVCKEEREKEQEREKGKETARKKAVSVSGGGVLNFLCLFVSLTCVRLVCGCGGVEGVRAVSYVYSRTRCHSVK